MPGYADRFITLTFPELGEDLWVIIRNPKTMSVGKLRPEGVPLDANGNPLNPELAERAMYQVLASLVRDWHVYDATSDDEDQPELPLPATVESIEKLPLGIINRIAEELTASANPE